jgi:predicted secreted protein
MKLTSILAIYALFWTLSLFVVLPIGVRTDEEVGAAHQFGNAESAPHRFSLPRTALRATILSAVLFALFYFNYIYGWIGVDQVDWTRR